MGGFSTNLTAPRPIPACNCPLQFLSLGQLPLTVSYQYITVLDGFPVTLGSSNCSITALAVSELNFRPWTDPVQTVGWGCYTKPNPEGVTTGQTLRLVPWPRPGGSSA
ncbi:hypothetical protein F2Q69_00005934 [Brassica cretica]|uniref:Uncharacterized protein n=1 Tax=Brassica cretica TaxID=69181 RepID=A0A8S9PD88_BRACR|nr:hypothetical protein F2Q69_00005934 [Brassica cretica]